MSLASNKVTLLDYGLGNLFSVKRSFEVCGASVIITSDPLQVLRSERLVLPGVGAFYEGMKQLKAKGLDDVLREYSRLNRPLLGICLGMQMFADTSEEFGLVSGLGIIPGKVISIPALSITGKSLKVPRVGWYNLTQVPNGCKWENSILDGVSETDELYVVHSYSMLPMHQNHWLARSLFGGHDLCVGVQKENIFGCQFHPEKSGDIGQKILKSFLKI